MSYTAIYSDFKTEDGGYPKILDLEKLKRALRRIESEHFLEKRGDKDSILVTREVEDKSRYPYLKYLVITEFRTWEEEIYDEPNLERCGIGYDSGDGLFSLLECISLCTEPFTLYHSAHPNNWGFPDVEPEYYIIKCDTGKINVTRQTYSPNPLGNVYETSDKDRQNLVEDMEDEE